MIYALSTGRFLCINAWSNPSLCPHAPQFPFTYPILRSRNVFKGLRQMPTANVHDHRLIRLLRYSAVIPKMRSRSPPKASQRADFQNLPLFSKEEQIPSNNSISQVHLSHNNTRPSSASWNPILDSVHSRLHLPRLLFRVLLIITRNNHIPLLSLLSLPLPLSPKPKRNNIPVPQSRP